MVFSDRNRESNKKNKKIEESIDLYDGLIKRFPDLIVIMDLEGRIVTISDTIQEVYGIDSKENFIGKDITELIVFEDRETLRSDIQSTLKSGYLKMAEYSFQG